VGDLPEVIEELQKAYPPPDRQGFTIFMTACRAPANHHRQNPLLEIPGARATGR